MTEQNTINLGADVPIFFMPTEGDIAAVREQMVGRKFDVSMLLGVAARCRHGCARVLVCKSLHEGRPFPTNFWLSCPQLARRLGETESSGGVGELERLIQEEALDDWIEYNKLHARIRIRLAGDCESAGIRDMGVGIGGIRYGREVHVKCLHLQMASFLALGHHPGEKFLNSLTEGTCMKC